MVIWMSSAFFFFIARIILPPKVFIWKRLFYRELIYSSHVGGDCTHCLLLALVLIVTKKSIKMEESCHMDSVILQLLKDGLSP